MIRFVLWAAAALIVLIVIVLPIIAFVASLVRGLLLVAVIAGAIYLYFRIKAPADE